MTVINGQRKFGRVEPQAQMALRSEETGEILGLVADISCGGLKLDGTIRLELETELAVILDLQGDFADLGPLKLVACTRWRRALDEPDRCHQGLEFVQPLAADSARKLADLVYRLSI